MNSIYTENLIFGTMRLLESFCHVDDISHFLIELHEKQITFLHVSDEYASYQVLCEALKILKKNRPDICFSYMVKLGEPHFDSENFSSVKLIEKVSQYCKELGITKIDVVQWMWRYSLQDDDKRIFDFKNAQDTIRKTVGALKKAKKINQFLCFPYSVNFARTAIYQDFIDGLAVYYNPIETDYASVIDEANQLKKVVYGIRPFAAGKLFDQNWTSAQLLAYTFSTGLIQKTIFTASKKEHIKKLFDHYECEKIV